MKFFIFSLMLAAAAHAITCTEGLLMYYKNVYSLFFEIDGAILDSTYISRDNGIFESMKLIREENRILYITNSNEEGPLQSDTSLYFYLINDISSPADSSIAYKKSVIGDTTFIEAITDEPDDEDDPRISKQNIKLFKNGLINDSFEEGPGGTYEDHFELTLKNDTLFRLSLGSEDGAPMDTAISPNPTTIPSRKLILDLSSKNSVPANGCTSISWSTPTATRFPLPIALPHA